MWADGRVCIVLMSAEWDLHVSCGFTINISSKVQEEYLIVCISFLTL